MATWMEKPQFVGQVRDANGQAKLESQAPLPTPYPAGSKSATSYWIGEHAISYDSELNNTPLPTEVDVVVIGSGITGATVAYELSKARPHLRVAVLDARGICTGATGRNGGHLCRPEAFDARALAKTFGAEDAVSMRRLMLRNRDMTLGIVSELGVAEEIDLRLDGTLVVFKTAAQRRAFTEDLEFAVANGLVSEGELIGSAEVLKHGGAFIAKSGSLYPRKLVHAMFQHSLSKMPNLTLHPFRPVSDVSYNASSTEDYKYTVISDNRTISARSVFHATNAWASSILPSLSGKNGVFAAKCHVMAIQPNTAHAPQLRPGFGYDDMWHWMIQRKDHGPFIYGFSSAEIIGDYDDSTTLLDDHPVRGEMYRFLENTFPTHFTNVDAGRDVRYDWTGIQGYTSNGASLVGRPFADREGEFMSVGHNGEGMARCVACATAVTEALLHYLDGRMEKAWEVPEWLPMAFRRNI